MMYKTSLDKKAIILTALITVIFICIIVMKFSLITDEGKDGAYYTSITCLIIYFLAFAFRPKGYQLTNTEVIIWRPLMNAHIKREDVLEAEVADDKAINGSFRRFGVGGLWGYYGEFYNFSLGRMIWYATRKDKFVLLKTKKENIILTPDNPEVFVEDIKNSKA